MRARSPGAAAGGGVAGAAAGWTGVGAVAAADDVEAAAAAVAAPPALKFSVISCGTRGSGLDVRGWATRRTGARSRS
eukprot:COSAG06_NODE_11483_length_1502_cov_5.813390_2_plen_76_part_01